MNITMKEQLDVVGIAKGYSYGPAFKFEYVLPASQRQNIKITFDDWISCKMNEWQLTELQ